MFEDVLILKKGGIHIKKENIGSFTRYCGGNVTQECIERGKNSPSAAIRKKSVFADNARRWKHENGGILKAQEGTGNLLTPHPLSPVGIALNQAKAMVKMKGEQQHLPPGVKEVVGPDGKKVAIRTEQPLQPLEQSIAEWMPGTGDVAEVGYIANDIKNGRYGSAALAAGLAIVPGNAGRWLKKVDTSKSKLTFWERMGIPKGERNWDTQMGRLRKGTTLNERELAEQLRAMHFTEKAKDNKLTWKNSNANWDYAPVTKPRWINLPSNSKLTYSDIVAEDTPVQFFHGTNERFNVFDYNKAYGADPHFFFSTDRNYVKEFHKRYRLNENPIINRYYLYSQNPTHITKTKTIWDLNGKVDIDEPDVLSAYDVQRNVRQHPDADSFYGPDLGKIDMGVSDNWEDDFISLFSENYPSEIAIPHNTRIKLTSPFVYDDKGHFIKLSKRDDFTNPDTRYKQGGKL